MSLTEVACDCRRGIHVNVSEINPDGDDTISVSELRNWLRSHRNVEEDLCRSQILVWGDDTPLDANALGISAGLSCLPPHMLTDTHCHGIPQAKVLLEMDGIKLNVDVVGTRAIATAAWFMWMSLIDCLCSQGDISVITKLVDVASQRGESIVHSMTGYVYEAAKDTVNTAEKKLKLDLDQDGDVGLALPDKTTYDVMSEAELTADIASRGLTIDTTSVSNDSESKDAMVKQIMAHDKKTAMAAVAAKKLPADPVFAQAIPTAP